LDVLQSKFEETLQHPFSADLLAKRRRRNLRQLQLPLCETSFLR